MEVPSRPGQRVGNAVVHVIHSDSTVAELIRLLLATFGFKATIYPSADGFLEHCTDAHISNAVVVHFDTDISQGAAFLQCLATKGIRVPVIFVPVAIDLPTTIEMAQAGNGDALGLPVDLGLQVPPHNRSKGHDGRYRLDRAHLNGAELTPREREVLDLVLAGKSAKQIAKQLGVQAKQVTRHRSSICNKLGVDGPTQLMALLLSSHDSHS